MKIKNSILCSLFSLLISVGLVGCSNPAVDEVVQPPEVIQEETLLPKEETDLSVPDYSGTGYVILNNNNPDFADEVRLYEPFETYSDLDELGRCGVAYANICQELMPTEKRGDIGMVKPSGWHTLKFPFVDGKYLYNRCHLIGYQLAGENANTSNLITGTRSFNADPENGMLPFENMVADYVKETNNHVLYRVTPDFRDDELVARGVQMEAQSVEDDGYGISFNVYIYNVEPGVEIDYLTGEAWESKETPQQQATEQKDSIQETFVLNKNSMKFHDPECPSVGKMSEKNKAYYEGTAEDLIQQGYEPCQNCIGNR